MHIPIDISILMLLYYTEVCYTVLYHSVARDSLVPEARRQIYKYEIVVILVIVK